MPVTATAVAAVADSITGVAKAIAEVKDMKLKRQYEQALANLDYDEKVRLNKALLAAGSETSRLQILGDVLGKLNDSRIQGVTALSLEKEKTKKAIMVVVAIGVIAVAVMYFAKKK